jgi:hypothetical protein
MTKEQRVVLPLMAFTLMSLAFLFSVSYTGASMSGVERPMVDYTAYVVPQSFNDTLTTVGSTFAWAVGSTVQQSKGPVMAFLGVDDSQNVDSQYSELGFTSHVNANGEVLGAYQVNSNYTNSGN